MEEYEVLSTTWSTSTIPLDAPWYLYAVVIDPDILAQLSVGTQISSITPTLPGFFNPIKVGALLYKNLTTSEVYTENGPNRSLFGIMILDGTNTIVSFDPDETTEGVIEFYVVSNQEDVDKINCFKALVWNKQCKFSIAIEKYLNQLNFGIICCNSLEKLKQYKRSIELLNSYDIRDIPEETKLYNYFSYKKIMKILHSIKL